jgi:hypothetical protein
VSARAHRLLAGGLALVACASCALCCAAARASFTQPVLVSATGTLEADEANSPAISADGDYVAFAGSFDGVSGVYRKDLQTGELALVAGADATDSTDSAPNAGTPSISREGRYISFTTTAALDPAEDSGNGCSSVYVRDMDVPIGEPGAYTLASALNGTTQGITYAGTGVAGGSCPGGGSAAAGRVALSESGREVAFTVIGESDLTTGLGGSVDTPPAQVAVRNLETDTTTLVSQTLSSLGSATPEPVPNGAAFTNGAAASPVGSSSVAISGDGSTVAWMGVDIPEQAPASDAPATAGGDAPYGYTDEYAEPLWRRIADGPDAPTRRVTGGDDPQCGCAGPLATGFDPGGQVPGEAVGPEYGSYLGLYYKGNEPQSFFAAITPQLSADGQMVAFLSTAPDTGQEPDLPGKSYVPTANAFVANMAEGLSRAQALTRLTQWASNNFGEGASPSVAPIEAIAISPQGTRVAFTTQRIDFPLSPPALVTPDLGQVPASQLYVANVAAGTLSLASYGYEGEPANGTVAAPSFSAEGALLAFASSATNLVYGAFNRGDESRGAVGNVFAVAEVTSPAVAGEQFLGALPSTSSATPKRELLATARPGPHGTVLVYVTVPGPGTLTATARAEVPVKSAATATRAARARPRKRGGEVARARRRTPSEDGGRPALARRVIASTRSSAAGAGVLVLQLSSAKAYRSLVEGRDGLYATIALAFAAPAQPTLTASVQATFHGKAGTVAPAAASKHAARRRKAA